MKEEEILTIIAITFYIISVLLFYRHIHISHSKGGEFESMKPSMIDFIAMFVPILNFIVGISDFIEKSIFLTLRNKIIITNQ
jgi:hypothetical protein